jgi:hypothetical protein
MATSMKTPEKFLHLKGMPKELPFEKFSFELNQALMATDVKELMAAGMCIMCMQADQWPEPVNLKDYKEIEPLGDIYRAGDYEQAARDLYVTWVQRLIMQHVERELEMLEKSDHVEQLEEEEVEPATKKLKA